MPVLMIVLAVLAVGAVTAALVWAASSRPASLADQALADPVSASPFEGLPPGPVGPDSVMGLRFDQVLRGYRMDQVDDVLDRLSAELRDRDEIIEALRAEGAASATPTRATAAHEHPDVTTGPLDVSEFVRPEGGSSLWSRPSRPVEAPDDPLS